MSQVEQSKVACAFASVTQAKRTFINVFPSTLLPPHYFESVLHNGVLKWVVLLGSEVALVPPNATDSKRCFRCEMSKVTHMYMDEGDKFQFAESEMTLHSAKVHLQYEDTAVDKKKGHRGSVSGSPGRSLFGSIRRSSLPGILSSTSNSATSPVPLTRNKSEELGDVLPIEVKKDAFYRFEKGSKVYFYADQMWVCDLMATLYGWKAGGGQQGDANTVRELFSDLQQEISSAKDLQEKVDLLDELALAARFNVVLKKLILLQTPTLLAWLTAELRKYNLDAWEQQTSTQEGVEKRRQEAVQYVTVLMETVHKTLFGCWPVFADTHEGPRLIAPLLEPKGGIDSLVQAVSALFVKPEEFGERDPTIHYEVIHTQMAVLYELKLFYMQAANFEDGHEQQLKMQQKLQTAVGQAPYLEKRIEQMMKGFKHAILTLPEGPLRTATLYHYSDILLYLAQPSGIISKALAVQHTEDFHFIVPRFLHKEHKHPLEKRSARCLHKLLTLFCPEVASKIPPPKLEE